MEILVSSLKYIHLLGFAVLTIGVLVQYRSQAKRISKSILYGSIVQLLSGFALMFGLISLDRDLNESKLMSKLGIVLVIVIFALVFRKKSLTDLQYYILLALTMAASLIAVFV